MDKARDADRDRPPQPSRPADADLARTTEPDAELATSYAAWRLEQRDDRR